MTVVVLAPHPDDEAIGCGGRLRRHVERGERVVVVFLTSGEAGLPGHPPDRAAAIREAEAEEAAAVLGVTRLAFLRGPDWHLEDAVAPTATQLRTMLEQERPETVYLPHRHDAHPDHRAASSVLTTALTPDMTPALPTYEVWTPLSQWDDVEDVTDLMSLKLDALRCYRSQLAQRRYDDAAEGLGRYRGALAAGCRYAEVFEHAVLEGLLPAGTAAAP